MANIISLHNSPSPVHDLAGKIKRAESLRRAVESKATFPSGDQWQAARNLHRLIAVWRESEQFNISRILDVVGLGGNGTTDSTKRLDTYTLPDDASTNRRDRIAKKPRKYLELARAIAAELGEPEAIILCQVFEGCSYGTEHVTSGDWEAEDWTKLTELIKQMASALVQDHDLMDYWRKVRSTNGRYDVRKEVIQSDNDCLDYCGEGYGLAGGTICSCKIAPIPSVPLGRHRQALPTPGSVLFHDGETLEVRYTFWLEVRLALGPVNDSYSIGPLVELRTVLEAETDDGQSIIFDNPFTDTTDVIQKATIGAEVLDVSFVDLHDYDHVPDPGCHGAAEHSYFAWKELSPALLRRLFLPNDLDRTGAFQSVNRNAGVFIGDLPPNRFSLGSAAATLHTDLLTGRLEEELGHICDNLTGQIDALRLAERRLIYDAEATAVSRWAKRTLAKTDVREESETDI